MRLMVYIDDPVPRDVRVHLCSSQIAMPEQFLDAAQVGSAVQQVRRKAVPQRMRTGRMNEASPGQVVFQEAPDATRGQPGTIAVQEHRRFVSALGFAERQTAAHPVQGHRPDGREPLAPALAADPDEAGLEIKVVDDSAPPAR